MIQYFLSMVSSILVIHTRRLDKLRTVGMARCNAIYHAARRTRCFQFLHPEVIITVATVDFKYNCQRIMIKTHHSNFIHDLFA